MTEIRKILKDSSIYGLGNIIGRLTGFIMLPIYTRYLSPADYGVLELLGLTIDFVGLIVGMRIGEAIFRYYCTADTLEEANSVISTSLGIAFFLNITGVGVLIVFAESISTMVFGDVSYKNLIILFSWVLLLQAFVEIPQTFIRALGKPWLYISVNIIKLTMQLSLNIYFIIYQGMRVEGIIYGTLISSSIISIGLLIYTFNHTGFGLSRAITSRLLTFSWPIMVASIGAFYVRYSDRYFIRLFDDLDNVGVYSLGYRFGLLVVMLLYNPFQSAWDAERYRILNRVDHIAIYQRVFVWINIFLAAGGLSIALFTEEVLKIMANPAFWGAIDIVPLILLAYIIQSWTNYCRFGILLKENTIEIARASWLAVIVISIAYLLLIPKMGIMGAALGTVVGFSARFLWIASKAREGINMHLPWQRVLITILLGAVLYSVSLTFPDAIIASITLKVLLITAFLLTVFLSPLVNDSEICALESMLKEGGKSRKLIFRYRTKFK